MKAAVIDVDRVTVESIPDPTPGPREVVVEVAACGICGTDLHIADGEFAPTLPVMPGHEFAGRSWRSARRSTGVDGCGRRPGRRRPVAVLRRVLLLPARAGQPVRALGRRSASPTTGGAAEFAVAPVANCVVLPGPRPPGRRGADRAAVVRGARVRRARARARRPLPHLRRRDDGPDDDGAGQAGRGGERRAWSTSTRRGWRRRGSWAARRPWRRPTSWTRPRGWDVVIDCTGVVAAIEDGLPRVAKGGTFQQFGVANEDAAARFSPFRVYNQEIRIIGSMAVLHSFERAGRALRRRACSTRT